MTARRLSLRPRRRAREAVVPMINVVFLLLIFFLMTAQIAPVAPFEVTLPEAEMTEADGAADAPHPLFIAADGRLSHGDAAGAAALAAAAAAGAVRIEADRALPARDLARILSELAAAGAGQITIATTAPAP